MPGGKFWAKQGQESSDDEEEAADDKKKGSDKPRQAQKGDTRSEGESESGDEIQWSRLDNTLLFDSENKNNYAKLQHHYQLALKPPPWLQSFESPLKWAGTLQGRLTYGLMYRKLQDYENQGPFYGFERFAIILVVILFRALDLSLSANKKEKESEEKSDIGDSQEDNLESEEKSDAESQKDYQDEDEEEEEDAEKFFYGLEEALTKCKETIEEMVGTTMMRLEPVFHHVLQTTKAHVLFLNKKVTESLKMAKHIKRVEEMTKVCQAGIYGLRAKFVMSMYQDYTVVIPLLSKALQLDPQFGYWYYLSGKVIRRLRREYNEKMVIEELDHFTKAVELERNPKFLVFLAQAYQELAFTLKHGASDPIPRATIDGFLQKSADLYKECWALKNDSASISKRVGNGMMKMRNEFFDKKITKEALLKADELASHSGPDIALGKYYYYYEKNDEKALEYFERDAPGNFATPEIIRLNLIRNPEYDALEALLAWLGADQGTLKRHAALCDCGWYYLVYKRDLELALKCFWEVLKADPNSFKVLQYQSYGFLVKDPINILAVLVNEILLALEKNMNLPCKERANLEFLEMFLEKVLKKHPHLKTLPLKQNLVDDLKMEVERTIAFHRRKRYGVNHGLNKPSSSGGRQDNRLLPGQSWRRNNRVEEPPPTNSQFDRSQGDFNCRPNHLTYKTNNRGSDSYWRSRTGQETRLSEPNNENPNQDCSGTISRQNNTEDLGENSGVKCRTCDGNHWTLKCPFKEMKMNVQGMKADDKKIVTSSTPVAADNKKLVAGQFGKYVPPHLRGEGNRDKLHVRVTNLSERTQLIDMQDLVRSIGPTKKIFLKQDKTTGLCKGFAYIHFRNKADAAQAIKVLNGHEYDDHILHVDYTSKPQD